MELALVGNQIDRLAAAAHYVIAHGGTDLGRTKLNKILWFADCKSWRTRGQTITGLTDYVKLQYGPVPPGLDWALTQLASAGAIKFAPHYVGTYIRHAYVSLRSPVGNHLSVDDQSILSEVIGATNELTAFEVSELSHDALWHETPHGGKIPVSAASVQTMSPDTKIIDWAKSYRV